MLMKENVATYKKLFIDAIKCELENYDNNSSKVIRGYRNTIARLETVDQDIVYVVESARPKAKRPFDIPNIGSLMEVVVRTVLDKIPCQEYAKEFNDKNADAKVGWCEYEIKSSMGLRSLNTPVKYDRPVLFINEVGVFTIKKSEVKNYANSNGVLPYDKEVGKKRLDLMKKLGYDM